MYKDIWKPSSGDKLACEREFYSCFDKFVVKVVNKGETLGHLPCEFSKIAWYFLARGGLISVEVKVTGRPQRCKQLCGGMEIPRVVTLSCSRKATLNHLKDLL